MKNLFRVFTLATLAALISACDLEMGSGTTTSNLTSSPAAAASTSDNTTTAPVTESVAPTTAEKPATTTTGNGTTTTTEEKPATTPVVTPAPTPAPVVPTPAPAPSNTGGALFYTTPNSITLRSDFAAVVTRIDALVNIIDKKSSVAVAASQSGNTWTIPQSLAAYPRGNVPNTWRIRLGATPPAGVTYHVSIMQSFVRVGDNPYGPGNVTYPPTTR